MFRLIAMHKRLLGVSMLAVTLIAIYLLISLNVMHSQLSRQAPTFFTLHQSFLLAGWPSVGRRCMGSPGRLRHTTAPWRHRRCAAHLQRAGWCVPQVASAAESAC